MTRHLPPNPYPTDLSNYERRLAKIVEENISTIAHMRQSAKAKRNVEERLADVITSFSGRMIFVYLHILWFGGWLIINLGIFGNEPFDPYPFGLLTMIVSLEAIFLSTFVLLSQNRLGVEADRRAELDLQVNLLAEHELTRVLTMLDEIQDKLGIENDGDQELLDLEKPVSPRDVLEEIGRIQEEKDEDM